MAAQLGRTLLIKRTNGDADPGPETFATICGITTKTLTVNYAEIDVTAFNCTDPGGPLEKATLDGIRTISLSGTARFYDTDQHRALADRATGVDGSPRDRFQVIIPGWKSVTAEFMFSDFSFDGPQEESLTSSFTMTASGPVTFAALP